MFIGHHRMAERQTRRGRKKRTLSYFCGGRVMRAKNNYSASRRVKTQTISSFDTERAILFVWPTRRRGNKYYCTSSRTNTKNFIRSAVAAGRRKAITSARLFALTQTNSTRLADAPRGENKRLRISPRQSKTILIEKK